jgi:hypothetical protein
VFGVFNEIFCHKLFPAEIINDKDDYVAVYKDWR